MTILYAIILGTVFGFVLEKSGTANPKRIIDMLRLADFHVMKTILCAIAIGSFLLYLLLGLEFIPTSHLSIKDNFVGVAVGGGILGLGWAIAGYCPGTGIVGAGAGRKDGLFFILGACIGALLYMLTFRYIDGSILFESIAGGKGTLANGYESPFNELPKELRSMGIVFFISAILIVIAWVLPTSKDDRIY